MNPRITGVGIKAATQPMRNAPKSRKKAPIKIARVDVSVSNWTVPLRRDGSHGKRGHEAGCSVRPYDEHTRAAEQRVANQWWDDCVESHDGWDADDGGIGHAFRHHNRPNREARQDIRQQPIAPVGRKPTEDGQQPLYDRGKATRARHRRCVLD